MIVCSCKGVSERTIDALVTSGARSLEDVARATGAGTDCGCCSREIARILGEPGPCREPACSGCPRSHARR